MSRRRRAEKRDVLPDPKFGDLVLTKFMNYVMYEGKKAVAENIIYGAFELIETKRRDQGPLETFHSALENVSPSVEVRSRRVGGATYQVPVEVRPESPPRARHPLAGQRRAQAWGKHHDREAGRRTARRVQQSRFTAVKKREDTHKMAEANRAFSHYRW